MSVAELKRKGVSYFYNDQNRFDHLLDSISCSITNRNQYLLENFQEREPRKWIELAIYPTILALGQCKFFFTNAANSVFQNEQEDYSTSYALESMFENPVQYLSSTGYRKFWRNSKKNNEPTDLQAEVMITRKISCKYIKNFKFIKVGV